MTCVIIYMYEAVTVSEYSQDTGLSRVTEFFIADHFFRVFVFLDIVFYPWT